MSSLTILESDGVGLEWRKPSTDQRRPDPQWWVTAPNHSRGYFDKVRAAEAWARQVRRERRRA